MAIDLFNQHDFMNRELSWLAFNDRIVALSRDINQPLLERVNFLTIAQSNLDEWYTVRIAKLMHDIKNGDTSKDPSGLTASDQLKTLRKALKKHLNAQRKAYEKHLIPALATADINLYSLDELSAENYNQARYFFQQKVLPVLKPRIIEAGERWPKVQNGQEQILARIGMTRRFVNIPVPTELPGFIAFNDAHTFVALRDLIIQFIDQVFPNQSLNSAYSYRILRDMQRDELPEDTANVPAAIAAQVDRRPSAPIINLTLSVGFPTFLRRELVNRIGIDPAYVFRVKKLLDYSSLGSIAKQLPAAKATTLKYREYDAYVEPDLMDEDIFNNILNRDYLLHHPYDSFNPVVNFFVQASLNPKVSHIGLSIYRVSSHSPLITALKQAALAGKEVTVLLEIKARFDEAHNLSLIQELRDAGVHVYTSFPNMKVHAKMSYVVYDGTIIAHLGTGNYNDITARFYTDLGLFTANPEMTADVQRVFAYVTQQADRPKQLNQIYMAPNMLRQHLIVKIDEMIALAKAGHHPEIWFKVNSLSDAVIIEKLYAASNAGVHVHLLVRGIATAKPNRPDLSLNIQIRSTVGRLLEHSRIYLFKANRETFDVYLSSADVMPRNLERRVELLFPILDERHKQQVRQIFHDMWHDRAQTFNKLRSGKYVHRKLKQNSNPRPVQEEFLIAAQQKQKNLLN